MSYLDKAAFLKTAPGFSTVVDGVARATEALLLGNTHLVAGTADVAARHLQRLLA
jgi:S-adenosylhomocysteine hydrolase